MSNSSLLNAKLRTELKAKLQPLVDALIKTPDNPAVINDILSILKKNSLASQQEVSSKKLPSSFVNNMLDLTDLRVETTITEDAQVEIFPLDSRRTVTLPEPKTIENGSIEHFRRSGLSKKTFVLSLKHGSVWGDAFNSVVATEDGRILRSVSTGNLEVAFCASKKREPLELEGSAAFLTYPGRGKWVDNYYHWMLQTIPVLHLIRRSQRRHPDYVLVYKCRSKFQRESFQRLNIPLDRVIELCDYPHVIAQKLLVPSSLGGVPLHDWVPSFLKETFVENSDSTPSSRVYVSRKRSATRRIVNEDEVVDFLKERGFIIAYLEELSVKQQATLFASAQIVVAAHGAGFTNMTFCRPHTKIVELFPKSCVRDCYYVLANACKLEYYHLLTEDVSIDSARKAENIDMHVEIPALRELMNMVEAS